MELQPALGCSRKSARERPTSSDIQPLPAQDLLAAHGAPRQAAAAAAAHAGVAAGDERHLHHPNRNISLCNTTLGLSWRHALLMTQIMRDDHHAGVYQQGFSCAGWRGG